MTPEERRAASRASLDDWRAAHGMPPWRGWRYANEDPVVITPVWIFVAIILHGLGVGGGVAIVGTFVVLVAQVHITRAVRRRRAHEEPQSPAV